MIGVVDLQDCDKLVFSWLDGKTLELFVVNILRLDMPGGDKEKEGE